MRLFPSVIEQLHHHEILIFGLGREGLSSYRFIRHQLPDQQITLIDDQPLEKLSTEWQQILAQDSLVNFLKSDQVSELPSSAVVIKAPGIPLSHPLLLAMKEAELPMTSNTQLFFEAVAELQSEPGPHNSMVTIGVTGTKGKSTTTALIHHVLAEGGLTAWLGGNIGVPPLELLPKMTEVEKETVQYVVLELSGHQLDDLHTSPHIAVVQNVVPEHLDYYQTFERYSEAKAHITHFQTPNDVVIINPQYEVPLAIAALSRGRKLGFLTDTEAAESQLRRANNHDVDVVAYRSPEWLIYDGQPVISVSDLPVVGKHNVENVMPALVIGKLLNLPTEKVAQAISNFKPLPHRLEFVAEVEGVRYYNDSLSTVPEATIAAIDAFENRPIILIAGGYDRGLEYKQLANFLVTKNIKALILFPPTGTRLAQEVTAVGTQELPMYQIQTMAEAVSVAKHLAQAGDIVLMSPASASFGTFVDYQDRGNQFKQYVHDVT